MAEIISGMSGFERVYDLVMIVWSLVILFQLISIDGKLSGIVKKTEKAYSSAKSETRIDAEGNAVEDMSRTFNREKHEPIRAEFTDLAVKYIEWSNMISTLTVMGLMGTVIGLMFGLPDARNGEMERLISSLSTALSSTLIGLLSTLILKIYVSKFPDAKLNMIEMKFDQIDRRYNIALGSTNVTKQ